MFLSKDGNYLQSIALLIGYPGVGGVQTMTLNNALYNSGSVIPLKTWVYLTAVYNSTASK
jgi:hypothetical protein